MRSRFSSSIVEAVEAEVTEPRARLPLGGGGEEMARIGARTLRSAYGGVVEVAPFALDRLPVTNDEYATYLRATDAAPPAHWLAGQPPAHTLDHPVVGVTLDEARRYAAWRGKRLPTIAEWEAAARGPRATAFPWGDAFEEPRCRCQAEGTCAADDHPEGATLDGVLDLVGNVWEWCEPDPRLPPPEDGYAWVLGGSFRHACARDGAIARSSVAAGKAYEYLGFRCARGEAR